MASNPPRRNLKDFAGTKERFRSATGDPQEWSRPPAATTGSFRYTPDTVKRHSRPPLGRLASGLLGELPRLGLYGLGLVLALWGAWHIPGILSMRGSQFSLVNHVLLVFTGSFLVFLASHERAVARGERDRPPASRVGA